MPIYPLSSYVLVRVKRGEISLKLIENKYEGNTESVIGVK